MSIIDKVRIYLKKIFLKKEKYLPQTNLKLDEKDLKNFKSQLKYNVNKDNEKLDEFFREANEIAKNNVEISGAKLEELRKDASESIDILIKKLENICDKYKIVGKL